MAGSPVSESMAFKSMVYIIVIYLSLYSSHWIWGKICRKPWFLALNMEVSCKFSLKPIHWYMIWRFIQATKIYGPEWISDKNFSCNAGAQQGSTQDEDVEAEGRGDWVPSTQPTSKTTGWGFFLHETSILDGRNLYFGWVKTMVPCMCSFQQIHWEKQCITFLKLMYFFEGVGMAWFFYTQFAQELEEWASRNMSLWWLSCNVIFVG